MRRSRVDRNRRRSRPRLPGATERPRRPKRPPRLRRLFRGDAADLSALSYRSRDGLRETARRAAPMMLCVLGVVLVGMLLWLVAAFGSRLWRESRAQPLLVAAAEGDLGRVEELLAAGADVNAADPAGVTALQAAARTGDVAIMRRLIDAGAKPSADAARQAMLGGHVDALKLLIAAGADPDAACEWDGRCPLTVAARTGDLDFARELLERGANPNTQPARLTPPPLHIAAEQGDLEMARLLLEGGRIRPCCGRHGRPRSVPRRRGRPRWRNCCGRRRCRPVRRVSPNEAMRHKYPEWVILVVARDAQGRPNLMPAGWGMICSGEPRLVCVAIAPQRYTHTCIEQTGEFVFAWAGEAQAELVKYSGSRSGADVNKFEEFDIPTAEPAEIAVPLLAEAAINLECRVWAAYPAGDHTIFVGEVVAAHLPEEPVGTLLNFSGRFASGAPAVDPI